MAPKRSSSMKLMTSVKKARRVINLETKLDIIRRSERGNSGAAIARALGLRDSTVRTILKNSERIKRISTEKPPYRIALSPRKVQIAVVKRPIISKSVSLEIESNLMSWYSKEVRKGYIIDYDEFKSKALLLYKEVTKDFSNKGLFTVGKELYDFCKRRFRSISDSSNEAASVDTEDMNLNASNSCEVMLHDDGLYNDQTADAFTQKFHNIVEEGGYSPLQIFTVSKTHLFWRRLPVKEINEKLSTEDSVDHVTLLLGCNAAGDFKLKPLLVNFIENPKVLKGYPKDKLPVMWKVNKKAAMTQLIFSDWFTSYFCPTVEQYCIKNNLDYRALLLIDSSPEYPTTLDDLSANIKVIFLPPSDSSYLQPMDESFIKLFKASYQYKALSQILIESETTESHYTPFEALWKTYDIKRAIYNIVEAWNEIKPSTVNKIWRQLFPSCVIDYSGFVDDIEKIYENITETAKELNLQNININYFQEELNFNVDNLKNEEWIQLINQKNLENAENDDDVIQIKSFSVTMLGEAIKNLETAIAIFTEHDPDSERSFNVCYTIRNTIASYRQLYRDKKKSTDLPHGFLVRNQLRINESSENSASSENQSTNSNEPQPSNIPLDIKLEFSPAGSPSSII